VARCRWDGAGQCPRVAAAGDVTRTWPTSRVTRTTTGSATSVPPGRRRTRAGGTIRRRPQVRGQGSGSQASPGRPRRPVGRPAVRPSPGRRPRPAAAARRPRPSTEGSECSGAAAALRTGSMILPRRASPDRRPHQRRPRPGKPRPGKPRHGKPHPGKPHPSRQCPSKHGPSKHCPSRHLSGAEAGRPGLTPAGAALPALAPTICSSRRGMPAPSPGATTPGRSAWRVTCRTSGTVAPWPNETTGLFPGPGPS
jgi:hypothetical protein